MDPFLSYIIIYFSEALLTLPAFFYISQKRAKKKLGKLQSKEKILFGYCFFPQSPATFESKAKYGIREDIVDILDGYADDFLENITDNFWITLSEQANATQQKCEEFYAYKAGFLELCLILEHEAQQYMNAMKFRHDDGETLKEGAVNEAVDVLLFMTCYRTFEVQLNLINRRKAVEIFDFCKENLMFLDTKYTNLLEMDPRVSGIRRDEQK